MKLRNNVVLGSPSKFLSTVALTAMLVACGGGTSGDGTDATGGATDFGGVGNTDGLGDLDAGSTATAGDTAGDGGFIEGEGEGEGGSTGLLEAPMTSAEDLLKPCKGQKGTDPGSSNALWNDNCQLEYDTFFGDGKITKSPFFDSTYVQGVQRIMFCQEHAGTADSIDTWADGQFGENTWEAIKRFQAAQGLVADGKVGPATWARLQTLVDDIALNVDADSDVTYQAYGIARVAEPTTAIDCSQQTNFFGVFATEPGAQDLFGGWEMSKVAGQNIKGAFSIEPPTPVQADVN